MPEGRQSPSPSRQSGRQIHDAPASGHGVDNASNKESTNSDQLKNLQSNPAEGPMDKSLKDKFSKTQEPSTGSN
ncbi:uncharacterized protein B0I36DRAFT_365098 [Microdochium trichocladiopsis]|uniref:Uncharacterized protein n=1 Tax=Microdochium trichocladiopsis TaxID=1682393 RepID=A0A9P9BS53_9PEZI|nr:uncharacterized protein B0I36DRAFT_365098 [Microdochium trichocladiopsis]KAH7027970.1 hypothetical protein B0I36DRAFT_365098 [Microdochium trichocladiopsis]